MGGTDFARDFIANSVTLATRVRIGIRRAMVDQFAMKLQM
jgi:hypothetical protein